MLTWRSITTIAARWWRPTITRRRFEPVGLTAPELELVIRQHLSGCRWVLLQDGEPVWAGRHGWLHWLADVLAALAGLPPQSNWYTWQRDGRQYRCQVWPGMGVAQVVEAADRSGQSPRPGAVE